MEQCAYSVVLEVAKAKTDQLDAIDQVVYRFGGTVARTGQMEVADLFEAATGSASQFLNLRWHGRPQTVLFEFFEHDPRLGCIEGSIEFAPAFSHPVGQSHLGVGVNESEQ